MRRVIGETLLSVNRLLSLVPDPAAPTLRQLHRLNASVAAAEQPSYLSVALDQDQHVVRADIATVAGLARDPDHQLQPRLGLDVGPAPHGSTGEVFDGGMDGPLRLTDEPRLHTHGEVGTTAFVGHGGTVQLEESHCHAIKEREA